MSNNDDANCATNSMNVTWLRWDHANLSLYKELTGANLQSIFDALLILESRFNDLTELSLIKEIDSIYEHVVSALLYCSSTTVPAVKKNFFKFRWDEQLNELKQRSILSCRAWKAAGKPRTRPIFRVYRTDKTA